MKSTSTITAAIAAIVTIVSVLSFSTRATGATPEKCDKAASGLPAMKNAADKCSNNPEVPGIVCEDTPERVGMTNEKECLEWDDTQGNDCNVMFLGQESANHGQEKAHHGQEKANRGQEKANRGQEKAFEAKSDLICTANGPLTTELEPVYLEVKTVGNSAGGTDIVILQQIHKGYHTYAFVPDGLTFIETRITVKLPKGYRTSGKLVTPEAYPLDSSGTTIYRGSGEFRRTIIGKGGGEATVTVRYQCCNDNVCLPPQTRTFKVKL